MVDWLESFIRTYVPLFIVIDAIGSLPFYCVNRFHIGNQMVKFLGQGELKAVSNVFNLLLAAIAVTMIIHGLSLEGIINVGL